MNVRELRYFLALCETLNFTRAAERCYVTQPAFSRAIQNLEGQLGGPLVHRERGNTHLTELGHLVRPYFEQVVRQTDEAKKRARAYVHLDDTSLSVGLMCTIGPARFVDLFIAFNERHKGVELYLKDGDAGTLEETLTRGDLDVAIYCRPEAHSDHLHYVPIYNEQFVIAVSPGHPLARLNAVTFRNLQGHRYLSRANCEYADFIRRIREQQGVEIQLPYRSDRDDWIQAMTLAGVGFTLIPEFAVTMPGLVIRPLIEPEVVRTINVVTVRGRPQSPAVGAFVSECKRYPWAEKLRSEFGTEEMPAAEIA
ncbi:MAG TPA: LysR family transcriptional regulator [Gammaproteobacteria bacterium]|nr:LysR family transcriptional regulator [Gammaproteobacteria bacterium]